VQINHDMASKDKIIKIDSAIHDKYNRSAHQIQCKISENKGTERGNL